VKIAQVAPLAERCPPRLYGGTERIVSYLTEELVRQGHDVTLFASGDSHTAGKLVPCSDMALRLNPAVQDHLPYHLVMLDEVRRRSDEFDIIHFHIDMLHFPLMRDLADRTLTTLHGRLDLPDLKPFYAAYPKLSLVSISHSQRRQMPAANWAATIPHGLPLDLLPFSPRSPGAGGGGGYLAFLGRISPEKRPDRAIDVAARSGLALKIAAKVDKVDQAYWDMVIAPLVARHDNVEFVGEINDAEKATFLGNARAVLLPIDWPEPFGLVMIEAMACGTPVIAWNRASVPEVVEDGVTGFIVEDEAEAVRAVQRLATIDRARVRSTFERRFNVERMAADYLSVYRTLAGVRRDAARLRRAGGDGEPLQVVA
jgi:glycosyltransferase involved in cell wall biosynthesis